MLQPDIAVIITVYVSVISQIFVRSIECMRMSFALKNVCTTPFGHTAI